MGGPCSIHDVEQAKAYGQKLKQLAEELSDQLYIVMRVYFEKPRTTVGWKGLINDPYIDGSFAVEEGLHIGRQLLKAGQYLDGVDCPHYPRARLRQSHLQRPEWPSLSVLAHNGLVLSFERRQIFHRGSGRGAL